MRAIRLGVIFDQQIHVGGGYHQSLNAALLTHELPKDLVEVVFFTTQGENVAMLQTHGVDANLIKLSFFEKIRLLLRAKVLNSRLLKLLQRFEYYSPLEKKLVQQEIDLVYFLSPSSWARNLERLNYITTVWDLCHREDPEFPEVRWNRQFEKRDRNYEAILPRATAVLVDSELGKKNVNRLYGVDLDRIKIMPFQAAVSSRKRINIEENEVNIREKYSLDVPYIFYPAQFWAHKNHVYLLEGLHELEKNHEISVGAVFSGSDKGNQSYVEAYAHKLGLQDRVRLAGFVTNQEIISLYSQSLALVMPTYFGPTNLPPLESFQLGVPVLYSDKAGLRDQVGNAALLLDLKNPDSMALHLKNLIEDQELRDSLIEKGYERLKYFDSYNRVQVLREIIEDFRWRRITWG